MPFEHGEFISVLDVRVDGLRDGEAVRPLLIQPEEGPLRGDEEAGDRTVYSRPRHEITAIQPYLNSQGSQQGFIRLELDSSS